MSYKIPLSCSAKELESGCVISAVIITIHTPNNRASIETDKWGKIDDVPVSYSCPPVHANEKSNKWSKAYMMPKGAHAFCADDEVLVLVRGPIAETGPTKNTMTIIGFADGVPRYCGKEYILFTIGSTLSGFYMVWNVREAKLADDLIDGRGRVIPPTGHQSLIYQRVSTGMDENEVEQFETQGWKYDSIEENAGRYRLYVLGASNGSRTMLTTPGSLHDVIEPDNPYGGSTDWYDYHLLMGGAYDVVSGDSRESWYGLDEATQFRYPFTAWWKGPKTRGHGASSLVTEVDLAYSIHTILESEARGSDTIRNGNSQNTRGKEAVLNDWTDRTNRIELKSVATKHYEGDHPDTGEPMYSRQVSYEEHYEAHVAQMLECSIDLWVVSYAWDLGYMTMKFVMDYSYHYPGPGLPPTFTRNETITATMINGETYTAESTCDVQDGVGELDIEQVFWDGDGMYAHEVAITWEYLWSHRVKRNYSLSMSRGDLGSDLLEEEITIPMVRAYVKWDSIAHSGYSVYSMVKKVCNTENRNVDLEEAIQNLLETYIESRLAEEYEPMPQDVHSQSLAKSVTRFNIDDYFLNFPMKGEAVIARVNLNA